VFIHGNVSASYTLTSKQKNSHYSAASTGFSSSHLADGKWSRIKPLISPAKLAHFQAKWTPVRMKTSRKENAIK